MNWLKGWPVFYTGVALLSAGSALHGIDAGLIVAGVCLIVAGFGQVIVDD